MESVDSLEETLTDIKISFCIHLAWKGNTGNLKSDNNTQIENINETLNLIKILKKLNIGKFIGIGTIAEKEILTYNLLDECSLNPSSKYGVAKLSTHLLSKIYCQELNIKHIWCTLGNVYGIGDRTNNIVNRTIEIFSSNDRPAFTSGDQLYDLIYIEDLINALIIAATKGKNNCDYYLGSGDPRPLKEYIKIIRDKVNPKKDIYFGEVPFNGKSLTYSDYSIDKIQKLGYTPFTSFEIGIDNLLNNRTTKR